MAGIKTVQKYLINVGQSLATKDVEASGSGVILQVEALWKGKERIGVLPTDSFKETAIFFRLVGSGGGGFFPDTSNVIVVPARGQFVWFNPYKTVLEQAADTINKLRSGPVPPQFVYTNGFRIEAVAEPFNVAVHDMQFKIVYLEF